MTPFIYKLKKHLWLITFPVVLSTILALSSLKTIETGFERFRFGRDITLYLRSSTDYLTYLGAAYTATRDKKFLEQFNGHLKEREMYFNNEVFISKILTQEELKQFRIGLDISNELAKDVENPAFEKMDSKAFFSEKYLMYKTNIYASNTKFRSLINDSSENTIKEESRKLSVFLYSLAFLVVIIAFLIKFGDSENKPVKKPLKKKKR
jgi:hypothetical protein